MADKQHEILTRALDRQKRARLQAEKILEEKSLELFEMARQLREANARLENLLLEKTSELEGVFVNIVDPYVVMDLEGFVIRMNGAAKDFLGFDPEKERVNLASLVHPDYRAYTREAMANLVVHGAMQNYRAKIIVCGGLEKFVQINASVVYDHKNQPIAAQGIARDITREHEVEQLLRQQKRELDVILENSPIGIALTEAGRYVRCNKPFIQMLGMAEHEILGKHVRDITHPEDYERSHALMESLNSGEQEFISLEKRYRRKDGSYFLAQTTVNPVRNDNNQVAYHVAVVEDITARRQAERLVIDSESRLSTLIANLNTAILLENESGSIALTNQRFCNMFGIPAPPEALRGMDCKDAATASKVLFKDEEGFLQRIGVILSRRVMVQGDELELKDGRVLQRDYIPIFTEGEYRGHLWTYSDITLSRNYKRTLEQQKEKFSSIIANMNLGLVEVDLDDKIQLVNQSFCAMSGYSEKELIGKVATDKVRVTEPGTIEAKNSLRAQGVSDSYEVEVIRKDGQKRHWLISGAPRYDETGQCVGSIGIHLDITDQKILELQKEELLAELQNSNEGLQEYAHIVSHDLKSPLRSIHALASWLRSDYSDRLDDTGKEHLEHMVDRVERMDKLIDGILQYSSIGNRAEESSGKVDLNLLIEEIRKTIHVPEHVTLRADGKLPVICGDRIQFHQLFQNLISNAIQHMDKPEGQVTVRAAEREAHWEFSVADNGCGIPEAFHERIFEIFESVDREKKGTGIGLAIVKKVVARYGGTIWLKSEVGTGTTFFFTLKKCDL